MTGKYDHLTDDEKRALLRVLKTQALDALERLLYHYRAVIKTRTDVETDDYRDIVRYIDRLEWTLKRDGVEILPDE